MLGLDFVLNSTKGKLVSGRKQGGFSGVSTDSRNISAGEIFFALKGDNYDGHEYVNEALKKGAGGAVIEDGSLARNNGKLLIRVPSTLKALGDLASGWRKSFPELEARGHNGLKRQDHYEGDGLEHRLPEVQDPQEHGELQ